MSGDRKPPDQDQRDLILTELDRTILVEAAAGTGKTTSMVGRMIALLAQGRCRVERLAAVTFTRQAAAEMRSRFRLRLEREAGAARGREQERLIRALAGLERCFIGTIHSFCARLLRERPVEAGVGVDFREMEEAEDREFKERAWSRYLDRCHQEGGPLLENLNRLGLDLGRLKDAFLELSLYPDVEAWPAQETEPPDLAPVVQELAVYGLHMRGLLDRLPFKPGTDKLIPKYKLLGRMITQSDLSDPVQVMEILEEFVKGEVKVVAGRWPQDLVIPADELARWEAFRRDHAEPLVRTWRQLRYRAAIAALTPALELYDELRQEAGTLSFQDLLLKAAGLLRGDPRIRRYFRRRFSHLLVDEFQDTDPVQAEVMLLLTADDEAETDWRRCRPVPGSLFVVGDPKQSIYRFRRADIVTYNRVKEIIRESNGLVLSLAANFRTVGAIRDWVNPTFEHIFPKEADDFSPAHVPILAGRAEDPEAQPPGVGTLVIPKAARYNPQVLAHESSFIAAWIRQAVDQGLALPRTRSQLDRGLSRTARPGDFMIISPQRKNLSLYSSALAGAGLDHQVVGGTTVNDLEPLWLLRICLRAVLRPHDPLALAALLRGRLFGFSDPQLLAFKDAGGVFDYRTALPNGLDPGTVARFGSAFERLGKYASWFRRLPSLAALERTAADLGLTALAAAGPEGDMEAGSLAKGLEHLRNRQHGQWSSASLLDGLEELLSQNPRMDGISAIWPGEDRVRIMNLHQAKGLEAPVVFLADPTGGNGNHPVSVHIDRSGERSLGYLSLTQKLGFQSRILAQPPGWEEKEAREARFVQAEQERLLYVAATRAGAGLFISQRGSSPKSNKWLPLVEHLGEAQELEQPGPPEPAREHAPAPEPGRVPGDLERIRERWAKAARPSYRSGAAKAVSMGPTDYEAKPGGRGKEWGTVIHNLLEAALISPGADLGGLAFSFLADQELDLDLAAEALDQVRRVTESQIWQRALRSPQRLAEAGFETLLDLEDGLEESHVRGAIDLVFEEGEGWVIVDYKTDAVGPGGPGAILEKYRPQLEIYARAWSLLTGQKVVEKGLLLVGTGDYLTL